MLGAANLTRFADWASRGSGVDLRDYPSLHRWSVDQPGEFWRSIWEFCDVRGHLEGPALIRGSGMTDARWFPEAHLNYAENLLRRRDSSPAIVFWGEDKVQRSLSWAELYRNVAAVAAQLRTLGVGEGDRVAGYLPNMPEAAIAMLATASIGAVWSSCSPDFGVQGVLERFGQIDPKVLFACDGYWFNGEHVDIAAESARRCARVAIARLHDRRAVCRCLDSHRVHTARPGLCAASCSRNGNRALVRAAAIRSSALHSVLVGHDGCPQVHRARSRRHVASAPQGASAAQRREALAIASSTSPLAAG